MLSKAFGVQGRFSLRQYHRYAVISNDANLYRKHIPDTINQHICKTEAVPKLIKVITEQHKPSLWNKLTSDVPLFSHTEMQNISTRLSQLIYTEHHIEKTPPVTPIPIPPYRVTCGKCGSNRISHPIYGKYGYFVKCDSCGKTTSLSIPCPVCQAKTKASKKADAYTLTCEAGHKHQLVFAANHGAQ